jgi:hypothetical protein
MRTVKDLKVGDIVHFTHVNRGNGRTLFETEITKIGSKIIHTTAGKIDKETLLEYGDYSHARLILNPEVFLSDLKRSSLTRDIIHSLQYEGRTNPPSLETLKKVCDLLGLVY